jgi:hypothetical protein
LKGQCVALRFGEHCEAFTWQIPMGIPALRLENFLLTKGPSCATCRVFLTRFAEAATSRLSMGAIAIELGFKNLEQLERYLRKRNFPAPLRLSGWFMVLSWLERKMSINALASEDGTEPSVYHRTVNRVMNQPWSAVRMAGVPGWLEAFRWAVIMRTRCCCHLDPTGLRAAQGTSQQCLAKEPQQMASKKRS